MSDLIAMPFGDVKITTMTPAEMAAVPGWRDAEVQTFGSEDDARPSPKETPMSTWTGKERAEALGMTFAGQAFRHIAGYESALTEMEQALRDEMALVAALVARATKRAFAIPTDADARARIVLNKYALPTGPGK